VGEVRDDLLRMLFVCCDEAIPMESQLVLALKTLCGFEIREIALRLFASEANVYKRLGRARSRLRQLPLHPGELTGEQYPSRLPAVHKILYLVFTEGYLSSQSEMAIRRELCDEAIRLATILAEHPAGSAIRLCCSCRSFGGSRPAITLANCSNENTSPFARLYADQKHSTAIDGQS